MARWPKLSLGATWQCMCINNTNVRLVNPKNVTYSADCTISCLMPVMWTEMYTAKIHGRSISLRSRINTRVSIPRTAAMIFSCKSNKSVGWKSSRIWYKWGQIPPLRVTEQAHQEQGRQTSHLLFFCAVCGSSPSINNQPSAPLLLPFSLS